MPSFRLIFNVHELLPNNSPEAVMDTAVAVAGSHAFVEAKQLNVRYKGGVPVPEITLRFTLPDSSVAAEDRAALAVQADVLAALGNIAVTSGYQVRRRSGGRWTVVVPKSNWGN